MIDRTISAPGVLGAKGSLNLASSLTVLALLSVSFAAAAAAGDAAASRFWVSGKSQRYAMKEERSATAATENKPIVITGIVTISASQDGSGGSDIKWSTSEVAVRPDPEP